ncbi:hypothetical protein RmaAA338_19340 [Rhodothermus marinus]|nr:hypothetical protein RmaAA338_19340 [Rhodothermus marinus]
MRGMQRNKTAGILLAVLLTPVVLILSSCTDLTEETFSVVTPENFYKTEKEITAALAPIYAQLRALEWNYWNLSQVSSDETVVPTRGQDWFDGGRWLAIHRHQWDPSLVDINGAWVDSYTGIARANGLLQTLAEIEAPNEAQLEAEVRLLRAFFYYTLLDFFGNVPIVGDDEFVVDPNNPPANATRAEVFNFIESELLEIYDNLPEQPPLAGRVTKWVADAILASMYLNAGVFTRNSDQLNPTGYNSCVDVQVSGGQNACQAAIQRADNIINSGYFRLAQDASEWLAMFLPNNENAPEVIFAIQHLPENGLGMTFQMRTLHYNQLSPSPWNGHAILAETYNKFDQDDARRTIFLVGQQYAEPRGNCVGSQCYSQGDPLTDRTGAPLVYTPEIQNVTNANEREGVRVLKYGPDPNNVNGNHGNDYAWFRLAEIYLIKAEALNELNGPSQQVIDLINEVRARVFDPPKPLNLADYSSREALRQAILDERLFELTWEAKRRQDLIRHGQFTRAWEFKDPSNPRVLLFPIPQAQLDANPNLQQNPGY